MMKKKLLILLMAVILVFGFIVTASADSDKQYVYVTVQNMTYPVDQDVEQGEEWWYGNAMDRYEVELETGDTMMDVTLRAFTTVGLNSDPDINSAAGKSFFTMIGGLAAGNGAKNAGWMGSLNDWFANKGANEVFPSAGDEICWQYTITGLDIGSDWNNNGTYLDSLSITDKNLQSLGLQPSPNTDDNSGFNSTTYNYTLTLPQGKDSLDVYVTPTMKNKNFQARTYLNVDVQYNSQDGYYYIPAEAGYEDVLSSTASWQKLPEDLPYYKRDQAISVKAGDVITVGCAFRTWATMNNSAELEGLVYTITVVGEEEEPPAVDETAPQISEAKAERQSATTAAISFNADEAGSYYYTVVAADAEAPLIDISGTGEELKVGLNSFSIADLTDSAAQTLYLVAKDAAGNCSTRQAIAIAAYEETPVEPAQVTVEFAFFNPDSGENGGYDVQWRKITVTEGLAASYGVPNAGPGTIVGGVDHGVPAGNVTAMDAAFAAHKEIYGEAFKLGEQMAVYSGTGSLTKVFEVESYYLTLAVNNMLPVGELTDAYAANECILKDGDQLLFAILKDMYGLDYIGYFDHDKLTAETGEEITLTLRGHMGAFAMYGTMGKPTPTITVDPLSNVDIVLIDAETGLLQSNALATTDANGQAKLSFKQPGTYIVSANGVHENTELPIVAPWCTITVTGDSIVDPEPNPDIYEVTVKVGPSTANVSFYENAGYDENGFDLLGDLLTATDLGVVSSYRTYTLQLAAGTYSFRGQNAAGESLGGMTFTVPSANANTEDLTDTISLRQLDIYSNQVIDSAYLTETDLEVALFSAVGKAVTMGASYNTTYAKFPALVEALGSSATYSYTIKPKDTAMGQKFAEFSKTGQAVTVGTSIANAASTLPQYYTINAPSAAEVQVQKRIKNYDQEVQEPYDVVEHKDGTTDHVYLGLTDTCIYRVMMPGKITKAGYVNIKLSGPVVTFAPEENPKDPTNTAPKGYGESSILLNINHDQHLRLDVGEEFKLRAYRAAWQIVNNTSGNYMIEPDFHYTILSGEDVINIEQDAVMGQWAMISAQKAGTAIVEVTYDALDVISATGNGRYGASDSQRKGLFVITVGDAPAEEITTNVLRGYKEADVVWESEFDTYYFLEQSTVIPVTVNAEGVQVQAWNPDITNSRQSYSANQNGAYEVTIYPGNNIVEVTKDGHTHYKVIRGAKVTPVLTNLSNSEQPIAAGDKVSLHFDGLYIPVPKMAGIYNPSSLAITYPALSGITIENKGLQYNFTSNHLISFTVPEDATGDFILSGGYISSVVLGSAPGAHRAITDTGVGTNTSAPSLGGQLCVLPDITIPLGGEAEPAAYTLNLETTAQHLNPGDTFTLDVVLAGEANFSALQAVLEYDAQHLTYKGATLADTYADLDGILNVSTGQNGLGISLTFGQNDVKPGKLLSLEFAVKEDAQSQEITFAWNKTEITSGEHLNQTATAKSGNLPILSLHNLKISHDEQIKLISGYKVIEDQPYAIINTDLSFELADGVLQPGYLYQVSYSVNGGQAQELTAQNGVYTIPGAAIPGNLKISVAKILDAEIHFISNSNYMGAPSGFKLMLVLLNQERPDGYTYAFDGKAMYWSGTYCQHIEHVEENCLKTGAYVYLVDEALKAEDAPKQISIISGEDLEIAYKGDVNGDGKITTNDAAIAHGLAASRASFLNDETFILSMLARLEADYNGDGIVDVQDVRLIQLLWLESI